MRTTEETIGKVSGEGILREYVQDLESLKNDFDDLAKLAAKVTGIQTCLINLIDIDLQWTIGRYGSPLPEMSIDESICQYTILQDISFEVKDLSKDNRFAGMKRIRESGLRYYYGIPLRSATGGKVGTLCVLDLQVTVLSTVHKEILQLMAEEIGKRLEDVRKMNRLRQQLSEAERLKWLVAHDIRGPLQGINGLSKLALEEISDYKYAEVPIYLRYIVESGRSLLDLTNEMLAHEPDLGKTETTGNDLNYLRDRIVRLFMPGLLNKRLAFTFKIAPEAKLHSLPHKGLSQAIINLVANAIKFTSEGGQIAVQVAVRQYEETAHLCFTITDTGIGMDDNMRKNVLSGKGVSRPGTAGENGSGLGLIMVSKLVEECNGRMSIHSVPGMGTTFKIVIPT